MKKDIIVGVLLGVSLILPPLIARHPMDQIGCSVAFLCGVGLGMAMAYPESPAKPPTEKPQ